MTDYFGNPWPSGVCEEGVRVPTPVGAECISCGEKIEDDDQGSFIGGWQWGQREPVGPVGVKVPVHKECSLRDVLGGIGHLQNHLHWCVYERDPDGGLSRRESSLMVWSWVQDHGFPDPEEE
jgi:hypothetical protein